MPGDVDVDRLAISRDTVMRLTKLSARQVDYWAEKGIARPSADHRLSPGNRIRLYDFLETLSLAVAAELRQRGASLQKIRQIIGHLKKRGYERPLTELRYATIGRQVYFQHPDGTWEGEIKPDQIVIPEVLDLEPIRRRIVDNVMRDRSHAGHVERRRGTLGSKEVFAGTRVPVDTVRRYVRAGRSESEILAAFPDLTRADVEATRHEIVA